MTCFHTWHRRCEGVDQDSGYGHEESHLIHDTKHSMWDWISVWNVVSCMCAIACAFRWGVALVGEFLY